MLADVVSKEDKSRSITSRMILLRNNLKKLARSGSFQKCVLSDEKGMVISEYGEKTLNKDTISAMFALMHNVVDRTVRNLEMEGPYVVTLHTMNGKIFTTSFRVPRYERTLILTTFSDSNRFPQITPSVPAAIPRKSILIQLKNRLKQIKPIMKVFDVMISGIHRGLLPLEQVTEIQGNLKAPGFSKIPQDTNDKMKSLVDSITDLIKVF